MDSIVGISVFLSMSMFLSEVQAAAMVQCRQPPLCFLLTCL